MVRLAVVIPTLGRHAVLGRVLDRLDDQTADDFEVVVAADAAEADPEAVRSQVARHRRPAAFVQAGTPGVSAARNAGWRATDADVILFLGDDMLPAPDLIARHVAYHERSAEPAAALLGHVEWARELPRTPFMHWLDQGMQFDFGSIHGTSASWWHFYACNASVKRERLELVGGYDEDFRFGYEEMDLARRLDERGFSLCYDRAAVAEHLHPPTLDGWRQRMRVVAAAERQFVAKHPGMEPYFFNRFTAAAALPAARSRGARLARLVPRRFPVIGARVWFSADRWFTQQLAPAFLQAWRDQEGSAV